jgi:hypothetical protein
LDHPDLLLDYGAGRGWFLEACRQSGYRTLAGADTSEMAIGSLARRGFDTVQLSAVTNHGPDLAALPFRPRILTLLDVIEHFPPADLKDLLVDLVRSLLPELKLVVIKVPAAEGLLYRSAVRLAKVGVQGPIEQLYQVGTSPPHFSYFTAQSMARLLQLSRMSLLEKRGDRDFEPETLSDRARPLRLLPKVGARVVGSAAGLLTDLTGSHDASIFFAKPEPTIS